MPKEYESLVEKLIPDISILSLSDLREELQSKFKCLAKYCDDEDLEDNQALNTGSGFRRKFKGKCRACGKQGHKAASCRSGQNKFQGKCHYCSKQGHKMFECRKKKRDEGSNDEAANANSEEVVMTTMEKLKYEWCQEIKPCSEAKSKDCGKEERMMGHMLMSNETMIQSNKFTKNTWIGDTGRGGTNLIAMNCNKFLQYKFNCNMNFTN